MGRSQIMRRVLGRVLEEVEYQLSAEYPKAVRD